MKKRTLRLLAVCLALGMALTGAVAETAAGLDYTVEEKLVKQLQAGSGFTGTLTLEASAVAGRESEATTTIRPLTFDVSYIYVREDAAQNAENRLTVALTDGEKTLGTAELSLSAGMTALKSTLLGDGWFSLGQSGGAQTDGALAQAAKSWLGQTALPGFATFAAGLAGSLNGTQAADWTALTEPYLTKIDVWIEGFRQNAVLGKADDGTTTMRFEYDIPASAVKAQLKQMVMDMLANGALIDALTAALPGNETETYLNPAQQNYYFYTIDELPLNGDLHISRTVSLMGETLALSLSLPLYDSRGGAATLTYDRSSGGNDMPETNTLSLESGTRLLRLAYQTYDTLTGATVYQGTVLRQPLGAGAFEVGTEGTAAGEGRKTFSAAFTLTGSKATATDAQGNGSLTRDLQLTLTPDYTPDDAADAYAAPSEAQQAEYVTFSPLTMALETVFTSGQAKNASTAVHCALTVAGDELPQTYKLTFDGKTKGKWTPEPIDAQTATPLAGMDEAALTALLAQAGIKGGLLLLPYVSLPAAEASATPPTDATAAPTVKPTETPAFEPTETPTAKPTGTPTTISTDAPTVAPTTIPTDTPTASLAP